MGRRLTSLHARIYASVLTDKKFAALDPAAIGLWTMGNVYCWASFTDGVIDKAVVPRLVSATPARIVALTSILVKARLWDEREDAYLVHDWLDYNEPARTFLDKKDADAQRKKSGRKSGGRPHGNPTDIREDSTRTSGAFPDVSSKLLSSPHRSPRTAPDRSPTVRNAQGDIVGGMCAQRDRQAGREAGQCALSHACPRYKACSGTA